MKYWTYFMTVMCVVLLIVCAVLMTRNVRSTIYEGIIVGRIQDSFVVETYVPASADELIGLEIGDPYYLREVSE